MKRRSFIKSFAGLVAGLVAAPFLPAIKLPSPVSHTRNHALPARIDELSLKHWFRVKDHPIQFYDVAGQTVFPVYGATGGISGHHVSYLYKGEIPPDFESLHISHTDSFQIEKFNDGAYALVEWDHKTPAAAIEELLDEATEALRKV